MRDFPENDFANQSPQGGNYADYCDALSAERWLRLLDETRKKRVGSLSRGVNQEREHGLSEWSAVVSREDLPR